MTDFLDGAADICARIGEDPERLCTLSELIEILRTAGFPISKGTVYKAQMAGDAPPRFLFCNRSIYRLGDALEWALQRAVKPEKSAQRRAAQTRRADAQAVAAGG